MVGIQHAKAISEEEEKDDYRMIQMKQEMVESKTEKKEHLEAPLYSPPSG
jgi:hypothetical protein